MYKYIVSNKQYDNSVDITNYETLYNKKFMLWSDRKEMDITIDIDKDCDIKYELIKFYENKIKTINIYMNNISDKDYIGIATLLHVDLNVVSNLLYDTKYNEVINILKQNTKGVIINVR